MTEENKINTETIIQKVTTSKIFSFPPDSVHSLFSTGRLAHLSQQAEVVAGDNDDDSSKTECVFRRAGSACAGVMVAHREREIRELILIVIQDVWTYCECAG